MNRSSVLEGEKLVKSSLIILIILGTIKFIAGYITGISILIADAITTFADMFGVLVSYLGLHLSRKAADKNFKYGYYKIETFSALIVSLLIIYAGYSILRNTINHVPNPILGLNLPIALVVVILSIYFSFSLEKKLRMAGEQANSLALLANAKDKKMDVFAGVAILVAIISNLYDIMYVEQIVTGFIALMILKVGILSAKDSLFFLLDYWDNPKLTMEISKILNSDKEIIPKINAIKLRHAGTFIFGEALIEINPYADMNDLREELKILKNEIKKINPFIKSFSIYTHIAEKAKITVAIPIKGGKDLDAEVANSIHQARAYLFVKVKNKKIQKYYVKKLSFKDKKPENLATFIKKEKTNIILNSKLNSLVYYNLNQLHHIMVYPNFSDVDTARKTLKLILIDI